MSNRLYIRFKNASQIMYMKCLAWCLIHWEISVNAINHVIRQPCQSSLKGGSLEATSHETTPYSGSR